MEALVSVLILGILLATVISIIRFSLTTTGNTIRDAAEAQTKINGLMFDQYPAETSGVLTFRSSDGAIDAEHDAVFYSDNGIIAFYPAGSGG